MQVILNSDELKHAIACYLRANAAVEVGEMTFSLKKTGMVAEVETTVLDVPSPILSCIKLEEVVPITQDILVPDDVEVFTQQELPLSHEPDLTELVDEVMVAEEPSNESPEEEITEETCIPMEDEESLEKAIENVELAATVDEYVAPIKAFELHFDTEPSVVEEMPVANSISISDILGNTSGS